MPLVQVALEEGFEGDTVQVRVDDQLVRRESVRTRTVVGLAELVDVPAERGRRSVEVQLPDRHLLVQLDVDVDKDVHLRVNLVLGRLVAEVVEEHRYA